MVAPTFVIDAPAVDPRPGGLLGLVTPQAITDPHAMAGIEYQVAPDGAALFAPGMCWAPEAITPEAAIDGDEPGLTTGLAFAVFRAVRCRLAGHESFEDMALAALAAGESTAVEAAVQALFLNGGDDLTPTPGTAVSRYRALGMLEQHLAANYGGLGVIHTSRLGGTVLSAELAMPTVEGTLVTKQGTPISNGGGYTTTGPGAVVADPGEVWLWASGKVSLWAGPAETFRAYTLEENEALVVAQRVYVASVEEPIVAVLAAVP